MAAPPGKVYATLADPSTYGRWWPGASETGPEGGIHLPLGSTTVDARPEGHRDGLGLYLARRIVSQLGGSISVESPPPGERRGTAFTVRLPVWRGDGGAGKRSEEDANVEAVTGG